MSTYLFEVQIDNQSEINLNKGNFQLCVQKSVAGGSQPPVQWLSIPLLAPTIDVSWVENYTVYYSTTAIQNGATISQTVTGSAVVGRNYAYSTSTYAFTDVGAASSSTAIEITNGLPGAGVLSTFGLSQQASVATEGPVLSPIVAASVPGANGTATFTPSETITLYFANSFTSNGTIVNVSSTPCTITLQSGVKSVVQYNTTGWNPLPSPAGAAALIARPLLSLANGGLYKYLITLSAGVAADAVRTAAQNYLNNQKKATITIAREDPDTGKVAKVWMTFQGNVDHALMTSVVEGLIGKKVTNLFRMPIQGGHAFAGNEATILSVSPADQDLSLVMWNQLRLNANA